MTPRPNKLYRSHQVLTAASRQFIRAAGCLSRALVLVALTVGLSACASNALQRAPQAPDKPWVAPSATVPDQTPIRHNHAPSTSASTAAASTEFSVPRNPSLAQLPDGPKIDPDRVYTLPELIDLAQQNNPETRLAWNRARQAALAVGMAEATFLPMLSANVIGGWRKTRTPIEILPWDPKLRTETHGVVPMLALSWLVFDFGGRAALVEEAEHASFAANVLFNAAHQQVILAVTTAYYNYGAAKRRVAIAEETLKNAKTVARAVSERQKGGIATTVEVAQAKQQVSQAQLRLVNAQGSANTHYQALLGAVGLSPMQKIAVQALEDKGLPTHYEGITEETIRMALSQRPDILAAWSARQASQAHIRAAESQFMPKVFLSAIAARNRGSFSVDGLPALDVQTGSSNVLLGVSIPIFDGGLRSANLKQAQIAADKAQEVFHKTQKAAVREISAAVDGLQSALAAYHAARELESAAQTTYDAALEAFQHGLDTVTVVTMAVSGLKDAQQARSDAHALALAAAANLAFLMGDMTRAQDQWVDDSTPRTRGVFPPLSGKKP
ncbi:MAG TPA: TolC family protein [Burkholderiaceae bacterium]|nr:TolC family protein [Burkholderiaceae bacterium]